MKKQKIVELVEIVEQVVNEKIAEIRESETTLRLVNLKRENDSLENRFLEERKKREINPFFNSLAGP